MTIELVIGAAIVLLVLANVWLVIVANLAYRTGGGPGPTPGGSGGVPAPTRASVKSRNNVCRCHRPGGRGRDAVGAIARLTSTWPDDWLGRGVGGTGGVKSGEETGGDLDITSAADGRVDGRPLALRFQPRFDRLWLRHDLTVNFGRKAKLDERYPEGYTLVEVEPGTATTVEPIAR